MSAYREPIGLYGKPVEVYRNLHRRCWSLRGAKSRRIVGHAEAVALVDVTFKVSAAGRARVLREHRKNVHAVIAGTYDRSTDHGTIVPLVPGGLWERVRYNPYEAGHFVREDGSPATRAKAAIFFPDGGVLALEPES